MIRLPFVEDIIGRITGGTRVRVLVAVDDTESPAPPAVAWIISREPGLTELKAEQRPLRAIRRDGHSQSARWIFVFSEEPGDELIVTPANCSCGAGNLAYGEITPGYDRVRTRYPAWLEVELP